MLMSVNAASELKLTFHGSLPVQMGCQIVTLREDECVMRYTSNTRQDISFQLPILRQPQAMDQEPREQ